jgi:hypothetical protein
MQRRMNQAKSAFVLLVVFFAGCAAERLLVVPPARADTNPQRWEYACAKQDGSFDPQDDVKRIANKFGQQGWELAAATSTNIGGSTTTTLWCFKRPLP